MASARIDTTPLDPACERYVSLATYRRNGAEVCTPVWIAMAQDRCYVFSAGDAGKVKRIRATPRVRLAACDFGGKVHGAWIDGEARVVTDPATVAVALRALRRKYGLQMYIADFFATLSGRMRKRAYLDISLRR
jgi:PPOX class probable F420-dependent enzyme